MKHILMTAMMTVLLPTLSWASSECAGKSTDGTLVRILVETKGATARPEQGSVTFETGGNKFGYKFNRDAMTQFFENDDASNSSAIVGLVAYAEKEYPVSVKYVGDNFVDMDLKDVLATGQADQMVGNYLRVWKGPGHAASDQIQLTTLACSVWTDL